MKPGVKVTAEMINSLSPDHQERLLASVAERDPELAVEIRKLMFTFEDIQKLDGAVVQMILREVPAEKLARALRLSSEGLKSVIFKNLSERAGLMLREEMEAMGLQRKSDVEAVQAEVVEIAKRITRSTP